MPKRQRAVLYDVSRCAVDAPAPTVAAALGVDPRTVIAGVENRTIPSVKLGRCVPIPREAFLKLFDPRD